MLTTLLSISFIIPAVWLGYTLRAWWSARREFPQLPPDVKVFYLLLAPPLTLALDALMITDRLFYSPRSQFSSGRTTDARATVLVATCTLFATEATASNRVPDREVEASASAQAIEHNNMQLDRPPYLSPGEASAVQYRDLPMDDRETQTEYPGPP